MSALPSMYVAHPLFFWCTNACLCKLKFPLELALHVESNGINQENHSVHRSYIYRLATSAIQVMRK